MSRIPHEALAQYWYSALDEEIGLFIRVEGTGFKPREHFRNQLYAARDEEANPKLRDLVIFAPTSPPDAIFIAKRMVELDP